MFSAHITGNVVVLAAHIVARDPALLSYILSVPVFMLILFRTRLLAGGLEMAPRLTLWPPNAAPSNPARTVQFVTISAIESVSIGLGPHPTRTRV
jgi:uncharacterized membrane protein YoaK (UPF0700 family)